MNKFRVLIRFPIGVVTVGRAKGLVEAQRSATSLRAKVGPRPFIGLVPDCRTYRQLDAQRDAEDAALAAAEGADLEPDPVHPDQAAALAGIEAHMRELSGEPCAEPVVAEPKVYRVHRAHGEPLSPERRAYEARGQSAVGSQVPWLIGRAVIVVAAVLAWCWWRSRQLSQLLGRKS